MLQTLPLEIVTVIASYIPLKDTGEFARTCQKCYFAVLPHIWHHLSIGDTRELSTVAKRLETNSLWSQRAIHFVRNVTFCSGCHQHKRFSSAVAASMFGIANTPSNQREERSELESVTPHESINTFGKRLLELFPNLTNFVLDFAEAARNFYHTPERNAPKLPFPGSLSLINYKSDNTEFMHSLLAPFRMMHQLRLQAIPVVSLCDDIDKSILTNEDIVDLSTLGLTDLQRLELSYLDSDIDLNAMKNLVESLPNLQDLVLEWVFSPSKADYNRLCKVLEGFGSLHPKHVEKKSSILHVHFVYIPTTTVVA